MNTKENLLTQAVKLFSDKGYESVSVREIVEKSEVTKPTLYHHFGNKLGVLQAAVDFYLAGLNGQLKTAAEYQGDIYMSLKKVMETYFIFINENPDFYRLYLTLYFAPPENEAGAIVREEIQLQFAIIEKLFKEAAEQHGNMRGREKRYASVFIGLIHSHAGIYNLKEVLPNDEEKHQLLHQFMHGIFS